VASSTRSGAIYGTGAYGAASFGVSNVTTTVDGVQASGTTDPDVIITADATHSITSVQGITSNGGVGQVVANAVVEPTGIEATETVNATFTFIGDANFEPESASATVSVGVAQGRPSTVVLSSNYGGGQELTGSVGSISAFIGNATVTPESAAATTTANSDFTFVGDANFSVSGTEGTGEITTATPAASSNAPVTGVSASFTTPDTSYTDKYDGFLAYGSFTNAIYGEGVYGTSRYGYVDTSLFYEVPSVSATASAGSVTIVAGSDVDLNIYVSAELVTDAPGIIGDEVIITADAVTEPTGVSTTSAVGSIATQTENIFEVGSVEATTAIGDETVTADANTAVTGVSTTSAVDDVIVVARSVVVLTGTSATTSVGTVVVANNARPTFDSVDATSAVGTVTVTTVRNVFQASDRNENRTVYIAAEKPRIVYIPQDKPRTVYVRAA